MSPLCENCSAYFVGRQCPQCSVFASVFIIDDIPSYMRFQKDRKEEKRISEELQRIFEILATYKGDFTAKQLYKSANVSVPVTRNIIKDMIKKGHVKRIKTRKGDAPALYTLTEIGYDALRYRTGIFKPKKKPKK